MTLGILTTYLLINFLIYQSNRENILSHLFRIYSMSFVCFSLAISIRDYPQFLKYLHRASYVMISSGMFMLVATSIIGAVGQASTDYNMSLSYYMVVPSITMLLMILENKRPIQILFFVSGLTIIIAMGSRGPILCLITFYLLYIIKYKKLSPRRLPLYYGLSATLIIIGLFRNEIASSFFNLLKKYNIYSRTLHLFLLGQLSAPAGRDEIFRQIGRKISENPIFGIGFLGDLRSHNIVFETILFNGIFFGSILIFILMYFCFESLRFKRNKELSFLILIFFSYAIPDALLNLTVWGKDMFWIFIGFSFVALREKHYCDDQDLSIPDLV